MFEYRNIETVRETQFGRWIYRFHETAAGVLVRRTGADRPLWSHGILVQIFDHEVGGFRPAVAAGLNVLFSDLLAAEQVIWDLVANDVGSVAYNDGRR